MAVDIAAGLAIGELFYGSYVLSLFISILLMPAVSLYRKRLQKKRRLELLEQFRDMLYSVSSSVSSGRSLGQAMEESMEFWKGTYEDDSIIMKELDYMTRVIRNSNQTDVSVIRDFAERSGLEDISDFVNVYAGCRETGGNLEQAIERATLIISDRISVQCELESLMAQKRFESSIVGISPFAVLLFMRLAMPSYLSVMNESSQGNLIMTAALILILAALLMIERINDIEI